MVDPDWRASYNTRDPELLGALSVNWTKLSGPKYYKNINPAIHLNPPPDSPIFELSPLLDVDLVEFMKNLPGNGELPVVGAILELLLL